MKYFSGIDFKLRIHGFIPNKLISKEYLLRVGYCVKQRTCSSVSTLPLCREKAFPPSPDSEAGAIKLSQAVIAVKTVSGL